MSIRIYEGMIRNEYYNLGRYDQKWVLELRKVWSEMSIRIEEGMIRNEY